MHRNSKLAAFVVGGLIAGSPTALYSQSGTSSIQGAVLDASGAFVPGAGVSLTNTSTGVKLQSSTDPSGSYSFPTVPPGLYSLEVAKDGFASYKVTQFNVVVGEHATENAKLEIASSSATVVVEANGLSNQLETQSNDLGSVIGPESVAQLPLNGRNFLQLGLLSGATQLTSGAATGTVGQTGHQSLSINIAGNEPDFTMYLVNGIQTFGSRAGNTSLNLSVNAIDQFEVHYGFFMPDLGPNPGIVDVVTKAGTNRFHGDVYEFVRTDQLETRNYFNVNPATGAPTPPGPYHQNQFGFDLGGPVLRKKLFFFSNYEGYRQTQSNVVNAYTPTQAMFNGDFSALSTPIYDPASFNPATGKRTQFAGNIIPAGRITKTASQLLAFYTPGSTLASNPNVSGTPRTTTSSNQFTGRVDYSLSGRNQFFAQGSWLNSPVNVPGLFPGQGTAYPLDTELVALGWTTTLSSSKVNDLRVGVIRDAVYDEGLPVQGIQNQLGITGTADANGVPGININGFSGFGTSTGLLGNIDDVYQLNDSFNWLHGNHEIKFGANVSYTRSIQSSANANARGIFTYNDTYTAQINPNGGGSYTPVANTGSAFADFLLGDFTNGQSIGMPRVHYRWTTAQPYVQDTWKARPDLTFNFALAWYGATVPNPSGTDKNLIHGFNFTTGLPTFAALGQTSPEAYQMTYHDFAPRVGLNYQPSFLKDTSIRLGWGLYYTTQSDITAQYSVVSQVITVNNSASNVQPNPAYVLGVNALPAVTIGQITAAQVPTITGAIQYQSPYNPSPYISQWNLDIQHTFAKKYLLDAAYIGNQSHHLQFNFDPIDCSSPGSLACVLSNNPYLGKYSYIQDVTNTAAGSYNALLVKFGREYSNGVSLIVNYTYSKALSNGTQGNNGTLTQSRSCFQCDWGPTASNVPQSLVLSAVADLPVGRDRYFGNHLNPFVDAIVGGWSVDAIVNMQKGQPFNVTAPNNTPWSPANVRANRYCFGNDRNPAGNPRTITASPSGVTHGHYWLKPQDPTQTENQGACFVNPGIDPVNLTGPNGSFPAGVIAFFGNSHFNPLSGPGLNNWDTGIHKSFPIHEAIQFVLRGEFFNVWNHTQFANPNGLVSSPTFGQITVTQHDQRQIQIGGTLSF